MRLNKQLRIDKDLLMSDVLHLLKDFLTDWSPQVNENRKLGKRGGVLYRYNGYVFYIFETESSYIVRGYKEAKNA